MAVRRKFFLFRWLRVLVRPPAALPTELQRAQAMIAAIDAGGMPLNPARINEIGRSLGLEVSRKAPVEETIARIRAAIERAR